MNMTSTSSKPHEDLLKPLMPEEKSQKVATVKEKPRIQPIVPVPPDAPPFDESAYGYHSRKFQKAPDHIYWYTLKEGSQAMAIVRWDGVAQKDGTTRKEVRPYIYGVNAKGQTGWHSQFLDERPLYNLPEIVDSRKDILFVEGEKTAKAARILFPDYCVTTTAGGSNAAHKTDFSPIAGRRVLISPDCGEAGKKYGDAVYKLCRKARASCVQEFRTQELAKRRIQNGEVVDKDPSLSLKENYDLADAIEDGWTPGLMAAHRDPFIGTYPVPVSEKKSGAADPKESKSKEDMACYLAQEGELPGGLLTIGSDFEIGRRALQDLREKYGQVIFTEGDFYRYQETRWVTLPPKELHDEIEKYDGYFYLNPEKPEKMEVKIIKLNTWKKNSAIHTMEQGALVKDFFEARPLGVNCASGFIRFSFNEESRKWKAILEEHKPEHRQRHTLPGKWSDNAPTWIPGSLHSRLLDGSFQGDADKGNKIQSMKELAGSAISGCATKLLQPRALILLGTQAENGKSQILNMLRGLLPASAISSVTAAKMGDERHILGICGKLFNASDELSGASAISSDVFKAVVTGETVSGRDVYKSRIEFTPIAQHAFATNTLPSFQGGMDRGVQRRLLVVPFNRVIPKEEKIENIGQHIAKEEMDILLAWAVEGALDLMNSRGFTITDASVRNLQDWLEESDSVQGWVAECVDILNDERAFMKTSYAYKCYQEWGKAQGIRPEQMVGLKNFVRRMATIEGIHYTRTNSTRIFSGINLTYDAPRTMNF